MGNMGVFKTWYMEKPIHPSKHNDKKLGDLASRTRKGIGERPSIQLACMILVADATWKTKYDNLPKTCHPGVS
jgi:hypothetical protein